MNNLTRFEQVYRQIIKECKIINPTKKKIIKESEDDDDDFDEEEYEEKIQMKKIMYLIFLKNQNIILNGKYFLGINQVNNKQFINNNYF